MELDKGRHMRHVGVLRTWVGAKGFGFLSSESLASDTFVHNTQFENADISPQQNAVYSFEARVGPRGMFATNLARVSDKELETERAWASRDAGRE
jgi:cold shock CspA family protein